MKKRSVAALLLCALVLPAILCACSIQGILDEIEKSIPSVHEYEQKEDIDGINAYMQETLYGLWEYEENEDGLFTYTSPRSALVSEYRDYFRVYSPEGETFRVEKSDAKGYLAAYAVPSGTVHLAADGTSDAAEDPETPPTVSVIADEGGYLFLTASDFMIYFTKARDHCYLNEDNTAVFRFCEETYTVPASEALTAALARLGTYRKFALPAPAGATAMMIERYGNKEKGTTWGNIVFFAAEMPLSYQDTLRANGWHIAPGEHYGLFSPNNGGNDNVWYAMDAASEFMVRIELGWEKDYGNGTMLRVYPIGTMKVLHGTKTTANETWTEAEADAMRETWGAVIPFVRLGADYRVGTTLTSNGDAPAESNLGSQCYEICDHHYRYLLEGYDRVLEANGYHLYQPPVDFDSPFDEIRAWWNSEESKYYNCYINERENLAVRLKYDRTKGNLIQIFRYDEMESSEYFGD